MIWARIDSGGNNVGDNPYNKGGNINSDNRAKNDEEKEKIKSIKNLNKVWKREKLKVWVCLIKGILIFLPNLSYNPTDFTRGRYGWVEK